MGPTKLPEHFFSIEVHAQWRLQLNVMFAVVLVSRRRLLLKIPTVGASTPQAYQTLWSVKTRILMGFWNLSTLWEDRRKSRTPIAWNSKIKVTEQRTTDYNNCEWDFVVTEFGRRKCDCYSLTKRKYGFYLVCCCQLSFSWEVFPAA